MKIRQNLGMNISNTFNMISSFKSLLVESEIMEMDIVNQKNNFVFHHQKVDHSTLVGRQRGSVNLCFVHRCESKTDHEIEL